MVRLRTRVWCRLDEGGTAIEYALVMAVVALAIAVAVIGLGDVVENWFTTATECAADITEC